MKATMKEPTRPSRETGCLRCGTCCTKGGPTLHLEDRKLVEAGALPIHSLYTIRPGEPVSDPIRNQLITADGDLIKLKGTDNTWTCILYDEQDNQCRQYENRPLECRVMECWNTDTIEAVYSGTRLTRADLLSKVEGLWELVREHETRCSFVEIRRLADAFESEGAAELLLELIRYDTAVRDLVVEKADTDPAHLDFLFGRPLHRAIKGFGLRLKNQSGKMVLEKDPA